MAVEGYALSCAPMRHYYQLQLLRARRLLAEQRLSPIVAVVLVAVAFMGLSCLLFRRTELAAYLYPTIAVYLCILLSDKQRTAFAHEHLPRGDFRFVRLLENLVVAACFAFYLCYEGYWLPAVLLLGVAAAISPFRTGGAGSRALPTPFRRYPFEFTAGLRRGWPILLLIGFVAIQGLLVGNPELTLFTLGSISLLSMSFILPPEPPDYVWVYNIGAADFLWRKIGRAAVGNLMLSLPLLLAVGLRFTDYLHMALLLQLLGTCAIALATVMKYEAFPDDLDLPRSLLLTVGVVFFPLLPVFFMLYYPRAKRSLNALLA